MARTQGGIASEGREGGAGGEVRGARARKGAALAAARDHVAFLAEFIRSPLQLSAILPTHPEIGRAMVRGLGLKNAKAVVEFGPGTGSITRAIVAEIGAETTFFAVELNARMAERFAKNFPTVRLFQEDAGNIAAQCAAMGVKRLDAAITALPWTTIPVEARDDILRETARMLRPGGAFTWVTYRKPSAPGVREFVGQLRRHFARVEPMAAVKEPIVTAFVQRCYVG
ncbi:methyltransferase domain-containing protein [soil metagenome]